MHRTAMWGIVAGLLIANPALADDWRDREFCDELIEEVADDIEDFRERNRTEAELERFIARLKDDLDDDAKACRTDLAFLIGHTEDDDRDEYRKKSKRDKKRGEFCEDVVEDVLEELEEFDEDRDGRSYRRAKYVNYLIKDLDRDERKCVKFLVDGDNDISPHKAKKSVDFKKWSYRKWSS
jgi:hypothetical protein